MARKEKFDIPGRGSMDGYTLNHTSPGPQIVAKQGDLIQVTLDNESVPDGITLHWHGVDVPAAEDGVAGVTQDAVGVGQSFVYRFVAKDAGTYWYHSHQVSHEQVKKGLYGVLIVKPTPDRRGRRGPHLRQGANGQRRVRRTPGGRHLVRRSGCG